MISIVSARFVKSAIKVQDFPNDNLKEFAFFGRSNSGKSSLINMLLNRKNLVKTGSTPGMTQTINFFTINESQGKNAFNLADLPGYGFAKLQKNKISQIDKMLYDYCLNRKNLSLMFLLMDSRRPPSSVEKDIADFFTQKNINFEIVATKSDKLSKSEQQKCQKDLADYFELIPDKIILTSTLKKTGREKLLNIIQANIL